jgi:hypothetical protein
MAEITYTYDPSKLADHGSDRMRFDLGDTFTDGGKKTCALCDQEYAAIISIHPDSWNNAKYACVSSIVNKLAFQNDYSAGGMSLSLSQRFKQWQELKKELSKSLSVSVPAVVKMPAGNNLTDQHYFNLGMHDILPGEEGG